jgi:hypothetical protein
MHWIFEPVKLFNRVADAELRVAYVRRQIARQEQWLADHANDNPERVAYERTLLKGMRDTLAEVEREEAAIKADFARQPSLATPSRASDAPPVARTT